MGNPKPVFFWFRRDLRLDDNTALQQALRSGFKVQCLFIFDKNILDKLTNKHDARVTFIYNQLLSIHNTLQDYGSGLMIRYGEPTEEWKKILSEFPVHAVYTNHDYEPYATKRDYKVKELLNSQGIEFHTFKDQVIFERSDILKDNGTPYVVFTPYKNRWLDKLDPNFHAGSNFPINNNCFSPMESAEYPKLESFGFKASDLKVPSPNLGDSLLKAYHENRDYPAMDATSHVSVHLRFGTVSIRQLVSKALEVGSQTWLNELIWREFYMMIMWHFPYVVDSAFKKDYDRLTWRNNEAEFDRWCQGKTGYPIVDAGMRQLNTTGFMHNRLRMITASFLTKHLLIDWRWGEAYFAEKLLDFELSSNNGGWQWAAGSGCDAAPYFRIFNPYEQTRKFDPEFSYIKKWVPEFQEPEYPDAIVEHKFARERCLSTYKKTLAEK